mmetsp:Transcript_2475/g.7247  ORF Transcript_2475/g.7247 Transcript_2475/m.7247 type:complete len:263 (+) Transcript_2475:2184-2972(+)
MACPACTACPACRVGPSTPAARSFQAVAPRAARPTPTVAREIRPTRARAEDLRLRQPMESQGEAPTAAGRQCASTHRTTHSIRNIHSTTPSNSISRHHPATAADQGTTELVAQADGHRWVGVTWAPAAAPQIRDQPHLPPTTARQAEVARQPPFRPRTLPHHAPQSSGVQRSGRARSPRLSAIGSKRKTRRLRRRPGTSTRLGWIEPTMWWSLRWNEAATAATANGLLSLNCWTSLRKKRNSSLLISLTRSTAPSSSFWTTL